MELHEYAHLDFPLRDIRWKSKVDNRSENLIKYLWTTEGTGSVKGVKYEYTLSKHSWYATYEVRAATRVDRMLTPFLRQWRIHRRLLEKKCKIRTGTFIVDGKKWSSEVKTRLPLSGTRCCFRRIFVTHLGDERVVVQLKSVNWISLQAHFSFTLVNLGNERKNLRRGIMAARDGRCYEK